MSSPTKPLSLHPEAVLAACLQGFPLPAIYVCVHVLCNFLSDLVVLFKKKRKFNRVAHIFSHPELQTNDYFNLVAYGATISLKIRLFYQTNMTSKFESH